MTDPKEKPIVCKECEKEKCELYLINQLNGQEICIYEALKWKGEQE